MTPLTRDDIERLRELLSTSCCAGPWRFNEPSQTVVSCQSHPLAQISAPGHRLTFERTIGREGELITAAVNALPALLDIAEAALPVAWACECGGTSVFCVMDAQHNVIRSGCGDCGVSWPLAGEVANG